MIEKTRGIVLGTVPYKDNRMIVVMYTREHGRLSFATPLGATRKSRSRSLLFQPLNILEFSMDHSDVPGKLSYIKDPKNLFPYGTIPFDPCKQSLALFLQEFLLKVLRMEEDLPNKSLYAFLEHSLRFLDSLERGYSNFHLVFLMKLARFLGLSPNLEGYDPMSYFDMQSASFTSSRPLTHPYFLSIADTQSFVRIIRMDFSNMRFFRFSRQDRFRVLSLMNDYYRLHVPDFPQLSSLEILKEVFD